MTRSMLGAGLMAMLLAPWGQGGPSQGQSGQYYKIPAAAGGEPIPQELTQTFRGGERACVFVRGDHDPIVPMDVTIYDKDGDMVTKDESAQDYLAVFWVPERTAEYRIVVAATDERYNKAYIVLK